MKTVTVKIDPVTHAGLPRGRVNKSRLDTTSEKDIALQTVKDDAQAMINTDSPYAKASLAVTGAIVKLKADAKL